MQNIAQNRKNKRQVNTKKKEKEREIHARFEKLMEHQKKRKYLKMFNNLMNPNRITEYEQSYNFTERWQNDFKDKLQSSVFFWLKQSSQIYLLLNMISLLIRSLGIWYASTRNIFEFLQLDWVFIIIIMLNTLNLFRKHYGVKTQSGFALSIQSIGFEEINYLYTIIYSILTLSGVLIPGSTLLILDVVFVVVEYNHCVVIYQIFHRTLICSRFRNQLNIFDLLFTLVKVGHILTIVLYLTVQLNPHNNWTSKVPVPLITWDDRYVYSMYFAYTTMLTVGYGDLSPVNKTQIMVVLLVQVLGVVTFAYVITEIGNTISQIRMKNNKTQHSYGMIERLSKYYELGNEITVKARKYVLQNKTQHSQINLEQENDLLKNLNDELRDEITNETNKKLMNKSLFFICYWTKSFRNQISRQLVKKIFCPNEKLYSLKNDQIYIIHKGALKIYTQREHRGKTCLKKHIKTMNCNSEDMVLRNVFGYSKALTDRVIKLSAEAQKSVVAYVLCKQKLLQIIKQQDKDFQYFHELKQKVQSVKLAQSFEVPEIQSQKQHYFANIKKLVYQRNRFEKPQEKMTYKRNNRRFPLFLDEENKQCLAETATKFNGTDNFQPIKKEPITYEYQFQMEREYFNYFKKNNFNEVLDKLQNRNYNYKNKIKKQKQKCIH